MTDSLPTEVTVLIDYVITTDGDFDDLCDSEDVKYVNLIPTERREKLTLIDG